MKRFIALFFAGTWLAVLIGPAGPLGGFWRPMSDTPTPSGPVLGGFIAENMVENLAFGAGMAILLIGRKHFIAATTTHTRAITAWLATVWLLASWMPHGALHRHIGMNPDGLLPVEWIFHGGAIIATGALLWAVLARGKAPAESRASADLGTAEL